VTGADEHISDEARLLAEQVRSRAEAMPTEAYVAGLAAGAVNTTGGQMTPAEVRALAAEALDKAKQVSHLLVRLANLLDERPRTP
jgi:hypothetical protein